METSEDDKLVEAARIGMGGATMRAADLCPCLRRLEQRGLGKRFHIGIKGSSILGVGIEMVNGFLEPRHDIRGRPESS